MRDWPTETEINNTGLSLTNTELAAAASFDRVLARKLVPLAFLITN